MQQLAQCVCSEPLHLVDSIRDEQNERHRGKPRKKVLQELERRLISPVQVLDHNAGARIRGLAQQRGDVDELLAFRRYLLAGKVRRDVGSQLVDHVDERAQWGLSIVETGTDENARTASDAGAKLGDEARLAEPRLTAEQHHRAVPLGGVPHELEHQLELPGTADETRRGYGATAGRRIAW